jgi:hypothetical protein
LKKPKTTALERKLISLQNRVNKIKSLADFLTQHPAIADISNLKPASNGLMGLVIDDKAFIRPQGLKKPGLRMERWLEDTFTEVELQDRVVCEDVAQLSTEELEKLLATIPDPYGSEDDIEEDEE